MSERSTLSKLLCPCSRQSPVALALKFWNMRSESLTGVRYQTYCCSKCQCDRYYPEMIFDDLKKESFVLTCPNCRVPQHTRVVFVNTRKVHLYALFFTLCGLCVLPYLTKRCKRARHFCSICGAYLGTSGISSKTHAAGSVENV